MMMVCSICIRLDSQTELFLLENWFKMFPVLIAKRNYKTIIKRKLLVTCASVSI